MKYCHKCGIELDESALFCSSCGEKQAEKTVPQEKAVEPVETKEQATIDEVPAEKVEENIQEPSTEDSKVVSNEVPTNEIPTHEIPTNTIPTNGAPSSNAKENTIATNEIPPSGERVDAIPVVEKSMMNNGGPKVSKQPEHVDLETGKKKGSKKGIVALIIGIVALLVIGILVVVLMFAFKGGSSSKAFKTRPIIDSYDGDTYALVNGVMEKVVKNVEFYSSYEGFETKDYIFFDDDDSIYVYLKKEDKTLEIEDVAIFRLSKDGKEIAILEYDGDLYYGKIEELEDLDKIYKGVTDFSVMEEFSSFLVLNEDEELLVVDKKGSDEELDIEDVMEMTLIGKRYIAYSTIDGFFIYDTKKEKEIFDKDEPGTIRDFVALEGEERFLMGISFEGESLLYSLDSGNNKVNKLAKDLDYGPIYISSNRDDGFYNKYEKYPPQLYYTDLDGKEVYISDDFENEIKSDVSYYSKDGIYLFNDDEVTINKPGSLKQIGGFEVDEDYTEKLVEGSADIYTIDKNKVLYIDLEGNEALILGDDEEVELDIDLEELLEERNYDSYDVYKAVYDIKTDMTTLYFFGEDTITMLSGTKLSVIYEGDDIEKIQYVGSEKSNYTLAFLTDKDEIYQLDGKKTSLIAEDVDGVAEYKGGYVYGVPYIKDDTLFYWSNGKTVEIGEKFAEE